MQFADILSVVYILFGLVEFSTLHVLRHELISTMETNQDFLGAIIEEMDCTFNEMNPESGVNTVRKDNTSIETEVSTAPRVEHVAEIHAPASADTSAGQPVQMDKLAEAITALATNLKDAQDRQSSLFDRMVTNMSPETPKYVGKGKGVGKSSEKRHTDREKPSTSTQPPSKTPRKRKEREGEETQPPPKQKSKVRSDDYDLNDRQSELDYYSEGENDSELEYEIEFEDEADNICNNIDKLLKDPPLLPFDGKRLGTAPVEAAAAGPSGTAERDQTLEEFVLDEHLRGLAQEWVTDDDIGPVVSEQLAKVLNNMLSKKLSADKLKTMIEENAPPSNVELLQPPRVTEIVWNTLNENAKSTDVKFKKIQVRIMRGMTIIARLIDILLKSKKDGTAPEINTCLDKALHAFAMLSSGNLELSHRRREQMRGDLNPRFARLCFPSTPVTTDLFGGEVKNLVEDIRKSQQLGARLSRNGRGRGRGGYNGGNRGRGGYNNNNNNYNNNNGYNNRGGRHGSYQGNRGRSYPKNSNRGANKPQNQSQ